MKNLETIMIKRFDQYNESKQESEDVKLVSKSDKGNKIFKQLKTRLFQHYDMPKGELSTISGGDKRRKEIVAKLSKEDKKTYRSWLKTPEGEKSLELWKDDESVKVLESKVIDKYGDELEVNQDWPGLNFPVSEYKTEVKDSLVDIIMREEGISEKDFTKVDETINKVKEFCKKDDISNFISEHSSKKTSSNYVAEIIYNELYKTNEDKDQSIFGIDKLPSNIHSRMNQNFYDYHTRGRVTGKSKYELNRELFELAQKEGDIGIIAQFCLQITRESIVSDEKIQTQLDALEKAVISLGGNLDDISKELDEEDED